MAICFVCKKSLTSLRLLCLHFKVVHKLKENSGYRCVQNNCSRLYLSLNSFKKHYKSHEKSHDLANKLCESNSNRVTLYEDSLISTNTLNQDQAGASCQDIATTENKILQADQNLPNIVKFNDMITHQVTLLISKLYGKMTLPISVVQDVINEFETCLVLPLEDIKSKVALATFLNSSERETILEMCKSLQDIFSGVKSEHFRFKYLEESHKFIKPEQVTICTLLIMH